MDWINITQKAIRFIEAELGNSELSPKLVAKQIHVSESHFTRAFHVLTGLTLSEYIRNRRLYVSAEQLKNTDVSILDVAHNVGYESPEAFSKAFKRFYGISPSESKTKQLKEFYPLQVKLILTQERPLVYSVEQKNPIYLNGSTSIVPADDSNATAYLWVQCDAKGYIDKCHDYPGYETLVGVSTSEGYTIKAKCKQHSSDTTISIPSHKWAIFSCPGYGPQGILETWDQIYTGWMPKAEYEIADLPQLEVYTETEDGYTCEIWIAIK